MEGAENIKFK